MNNYFVYNNNIFLKHINLSEIEYVLELGAHDGSFTQEINKTYNPKKIYSVDANPKMIDRILENQKNIENAKFYSTALWHEDCEIDFHLYDDEYASSSMYAHPHGNIEVLKIKAQTLDNFIKINNIKNINIILADVEGAEANIFKNQKTLKKVKYIISECKFNKSFKGEHFPDINNLKESLNPLGFELVETLMHPQNEFGDTLWINKNL